MSEATTVEAATVEAALQQAATEMGVDASHLEYEVVEEKKDFWGLEGDKVIIKAWPRASREAAPTPPPAPAPSPREEASEPEAAGGRAAVEEEDSAAGGGAFWDAADQDEDEEPAAEEETADVETEESGEEVAVEAEEAHRAPRKQESRPEPDGREVGEEVDPAAIVSLLEQIFHDMEIDCTVSIEPGDEGFDATVTGADKELLLEGNGRALSALELLVNNAFRHKLPPGQKVRVDAGDFRSRREDELADLAYQVAHAAKESGRTQETQPLNPYERRLVHLALAEDPAVTTRSRGSGFLKNVQIIPRSEERGRGRRA